MAYGTNRTRSDVKRDNLDRHLKIDDQLTSHLKPVKIGEDITGLQLADKDVRVENNLIVDNDLTVLGEINGTPSTLTPLYAGMILGYTCIGLNEPASTYNLTTSYAVPTNDLTIKFVAPPSGKVEIEMQIGWDAGSSNVGDCFAGLSTANATSGYSALADFHESELFDAMSRGALRTIRHSWTVFGLTAGDALEYWVGFKTSNTTGTPHLQWGGNASGEYPDFIMKAIALPVTIST